MMLPSDRARVTVEGLLKSMSAMGETSSLSRLLNAEGEEFRAFESAACRPLGTPSKTNLLGVAAVDAAAADAAAGAGAVAVALEAVFLPSTGLGAGSDTRRSV